MVYLQANMVSLSLMKIVLSSALEVLSLIYVTEVIL